MDPQKPQQIYQALQQIPAGHVCSYGGVAQLAGLPGAARLVGRVLGQLPQDSRLPWFRVIRANGSIAFPEGSDRYQRQLQKLQDDGIEVSNGKVKMKQYCWPRVR